MSAAKNSLLTCLLMMVAVNVVSADTLLVTINSDPQGATVYANAAGTLMGYTPLALKYTVPRDFRRKQQCMTFQAVRVRWASGVDASVPALTACGDQGLKQQLNFTRPSAAPGQEIDALFAVQIQQLVFLKAQAKAQAEADLIRQITEAARIHIPTTRTCYSNVIGNQTFTNCY